MPINLVQGFTEAQLAKELADFDDNAGNHAFWVKRNGDFVITPLASDDYEPHQISGFIDKDPDRKFRMETCVAGNGYVGPEAAADKKWVKELRDGLIANWEGGTEGYTDSFVV